MFSLFKWRLAQYLELRWWQRYLRHKSVEEYLAWKNNYWQGFLEKTEVDPEPGKTILDAGCGPAGIYIHFKDYSVTAIDPLLDQYESNLPHFSKDRYPNVTFHTSSLEDFKSDQQYDYIFCINAINHVNDIQAAVLNLKNLLKPGGKLVLSIDAHNYTFLKWIFKLIPGDVLHPHQMDLGEYVALLKDIGFEVMERICLDKGLVFGYWVIVGE
jgi:2-polyprenyl-3-methyl-5-hydroxy-6-metoxy-1,4-benzoquinol methylase